MLVTMAAPLQIPSHIQYTVNIKKKFSLEQKEKAAPRV